MQFDKLGQLSFDVGIVVDFINHHRSPGQGVREKSAAKKNRRLITVKYIPSIMDATGVIPPNQVFSSCFPRSRGQLSILRVSRSPVAGVASEDGWDELLNPYARRYFVRMRSI
ncbi:MAG: hypothetical protein Ct9H300mP32_6090 [Verrucomicrobiota bacterium]|nr:MAG: hypothetical protein Ct9H300mP32_6090 [Verrucomicrobiota bacterium]